MPLLDTITTAAAALNAGELHPSPKHPVILDANAVLPHLKPQTHDPLPAGAAPIRRLSGWEPPPSFSDNTKFQEKLIKKLRAKLKKKDEALDRAEIIRVFDSFSGERWDAFVGGEAVDLVVEACARVGLWDRLKGLILQGFVKGNAASGLIQRLVENRNASLLCLSVRCISSLQPRDVVAVLKYFLNPTRESMGGMVEVRGEWERQGLLAVEKAKEEGLGVKRMAFARSAAVLVMMAHDGFTSSEMCLHHVFSSRNADGLVMSSAVSGLDGAEVLGLVTYFGKWLERYGRFPEAAPCIGSKAPPGLVAHEWVPSLEMVVSGIALVLDEHFSYMVLKPEFHDLLTSIEKEVKSLASGASACRVLSNVIECMPSNRKMIQ